MSRSHLKIVVWTLLLTTYFSYTLALEDFNDTDSTGVVHPVSRNGKIVYMNDDLMRKLDEEHVTWHWTPWLRTRLEVTGDGIVREVQCVSGDSVDSFPDGIFDDDQLREGGFILYVLFGIYSFTLLAIVCNDFFIPCVELICEDLKIPQNVAAATFMSVATSCPEFFVNVISTFLTESDMGIGTIVGSAIFNALGVAAVGGLAAIVPIKIESRPVTRDVVIYMFNVTILVTFVWDGQIDWYEALVLGILYILYFIVMFNTMRLFAMYDRFVDRYFKKSNSLNVLETEVKPTENWKSIEEGTDNKGFTDVVNVASSEKVTVVDKVEEVNDKPKKGLFRFPTHKSFWYKIWWLYLWPLKFILGITIPSPIRFRKMYPLSFLMCIIWIGGNSYFVSWSMTVIGHTFFIPESVMGMTFLAFGGCLPEACSIFIMSRRGEGGIGVSNALGANSLAILFALGLPWLIKSLTLVFQGADDTAVLINSAGIDFVVGSLLVAVVCLYTTMWIGKFTLRRSLGAVFLVLYAIFITFAVLVEMGIILDRGLEFC